jgi:hypothetical protein
VERKTEGGTTDLGQEKGPISREGKITQGNAKETEIATEKEMSPGRRTVSGIDLWRDNTTEAKETTGIRKIDRGIEGTRDQERKEVSEPVAEG